MAGGRVAAKAPPRRGNEGLAALARAIAGASYRRDTVGPCLNVYFDESGTDHHAPVCVVAGLISSCRQWEKLEKDWQHVLDREGLEYLHMREQRKIFKGWEKESVKRVMTSLVNIIKRRVQSRVWTAIVKDDYRRVFAPDIKKEDHLYLISAFACASRVRHLSVTAYNDHNVNYCFEQGGTGSHYAFDAFRELTDANNDGFYTMKIHYTWLARYLQFRLPIFMHGK